MDPDGANTGKGNPNVLRCDGYDNTVLSNGQKLDFAQYSRCDEIGASTAPTTTTTITASCQNAVLPNSVFYAIMIILGNSLV
jgi:hypothetical protein